MASLVGNDGAIRVAGPNGFDAPAAYVGIDSTTDGSPRTVTYSVAAPGGAWDGTDNGEYEIRLQAGQVQDREGNSIPSGRIGEFSVSAPQTFLVTNAKDGGQGSLRDALLRAALSPADDGVLFTSAAFNTPRVITLASPLPPAPAFGGGLALTGPGASLATVRRDPSAAAFRILDSQAPTLTISGLTFTGGLAGETAARSSPAGRWP